MAQQFTLLWNNSSVLANPNATAQTALYRQKSVGGAFISTGFTPSNPLAKSVNTVDSPNTLLDNVVYEFKVQAVCTLNGPSDNDNGVREIIGFACITPTLSQEETEATISLDVSGTDIVKARFTLRRSSDNTQVAQSVVNAVGSTISLTETGLTAGTNYYWQVELYATINGVEVISSSSDYLGSPCSPYAFATDALAVCDPVTSLTVDSIEIV